jgi:hypothetical protein
MRNKLIRGIFFCLFIGCAAKRPFHLANIDNPPFHPNTIFAGYEDLTISKFDPLKDKYQLDTVFHGETNELKRILLLRNWIRTHIPINDPGPHPGNGSAESIVDEGLKGNGFHCGHYLAVQNAVMNAYGYVTRYLGSGPGGIEGTDGIWIIKRVRGDTNPGGRTRCLSNIELS